MCFNVMRWREKFVQVTPGLPNAARFSLWCKNFLKVSNLSLFYVSRHKLEIGSSNHRLVTRLGRGHCYASVFVHTVSTGTYGGPLTHGLKES